MNIYRLWYIYLNISNENKLILLSMYKTEENIYNNINEIYMKKILTKGENCKLRNTPLEEGNKLGEMLEKNSIDFITINEKKYPEKLRIIYAPPYVLFYKGDLTLAYEDLVAIIGSRRNTMYGETVTKKISLILSENNINTISGVASGIDSIGQKQILLNGGRTVGVLGCGIDIVYPSCNKRLYDEIIMKGLLISEFLPGTPPMAYNFPRRNRIISGLCKKLIVVEASNKSGSLITVGYALEQAKDIMVVPGPITNKNSLGCNKLIKDGATSLTEEVDLYYFLNITKNKSKNIEVNNKLSILSNIISSEPVHIDKIIESVNIDRKALYELLFEMQNKNEIICLPGNYYAKLS